MVDPIQLRYTYIASDNTAANGINLGNAGDDILVHRIDFGTPVDGKVLTVYDEPNPVNGATTNVAFKFTQATHAAGEDWVRFLDFARSPLHLGNGGNVVQNGTDVTVVWSLSS